MQFGTTSSAPLFRRPASPASGRKQTRGFRGLDCATLQNLGDCDVRASLGGDLAGVYFYRFLNYCTMRLLGNGAYAPDLCKMTRQRWRENA